MGCEKLVACEASEKSLVEDLGDEKSATELADMSERSIEEEMGVEPPSRFSMMTATRRKPLWNLKTNPFQPIFRLSKGRQTCP